MELLDIEFGFFPATAPNHRFSPDVDLHHVAFGPIPAPTKDLPEDHRDIAHEIDGVVVDDDKPRKIRAAGQGRFRLLKKSGRSHRSGGKRGSHGKGVGTSNSSE